MSARSQAHSAGRGADGGGEAKIQTHSGHRGLQMEEPLIFEMGSTGRTGVDLPDVPNVAGKLGGLRRQQAIGLPALSEPQVVRHYVRLSQKNYAIDSGLYPLGSCTMKHNPRLNEKMARLPGFSDVHPLQPQSTVQGALELIDTVAHWLKTFAGGRDVARCRRPRRTVRDDDDPRRPRGQGQPP
jgi:glycine dehydrogenase subunit 2